MSIFAMEHQFPFFPILFTFLIFIFMISKAWKKSRTNNSTPNLPPGPWKLPLIGSMHHLVGSLPHHRLRDLAKQYGPVMHLQLGELTDIIISSPETAKEVMKTHDVTFAQRPYLLAGKISSYNNTDIIFAPFGDYWRQMRKICTLELLTAKRVQSFRSIREEEVSKLIKSMSCNSGGSPINFSRMFNSLTYSIISRAAFGKIWEGEDLFVQTLKKLIADGGGFTLADMYPSINLLHWISWMVPRLKRNHQTVDKIFQNIIDDHRTKRAAKKSGADDEQDLVDILLNFQDQEDLEVPIADDNIKAIIMDIFSAGSETSSTTVEWAMSELLKNPRVIGKAQEEVRRVFGKEGNVDEARLHELHYLRLVIKETLRLRAPLPIILRECRESCTINGYSIPVKSRVIVNTWAIGRDPNYWIEPERFFPERFQDCSIDYKGTDFEFLPFGAGRRMCPGVLFGLANVEFPLAQLLYHFDWKLPPGVKPHTLDMTEVFGSVVKRKNDLTLIPIRYAPVCT